MVEILALLMFVGEPQKLTEMTYMPDVAKCLEKKRIATRNSGSRVTYVCSRVRAELSPDKKIIRIEKIK